MILFIGVLLLSAAAGFALGRVKNASKLAAVKVEIAKLESGFTAKAEMAISKIKSLL